MKLPFRFHRGELDSGFYMSRLMTFLNSIIQETGGIYDELMYWLKVQFTLLPGDDELPMRVNDILGIAATAGVFPLFFAGGYWPGALFFTESAVFGGNERSERGLYNTGLEQFTFVRTDNEFYPDDIVTQATESLKMSVVPEGQVLLGYTRSDMPVFDSDGNVIWANVFASPPVGVAYDEFYGPIFSTLSEDALVISQMGIEFTVLLFEIMQQIRYNGASIRRFLDLTDLVCEDAVVDMSIVPGVLGGSHYYVVNYSLNTAPTVTLTHQRIRIWSYVVGQKFKRYVLNEVI